MIRNVKSAQFKIKLMPTKIRLLFISVRNAVWVTAVLVVTIATNTENAERNSAKSKSSYI